MISTSIKHKLPEVNEPVLVKCPKMGKDGGTVILIAKLIDEDENEWYAGYPYNQPVEPTHWGYSVEAEKDTIIVYNSEIPNLYGNLKTLCEELKVSYSTYSKKQLPFKIGDVEVLKVAVKRGEKKEKKKT